ncbi:hypothetical protein Pcac1_g25675 [Phytophthora cactorum]|nr:hypothetical protein Pcac1_g25675 [Phytophthora cactorum]
MTRLAATLEELVNGFDLVSEQRPLPRHAVLRAGHEIDLMANSSVGWQLSWDLVRKNVRVHAGGLVAWVTWLP